MSDLQQISLCLKQATSRSLVLVDEFGKGTNESGQSETCHAWVEALENLADQYRWHRSGMWSI